MSEASLESLRSMTPAQFAALGADVVGFVRKIDAESLTNLNIEGIDESLIQEGMTFFMLISANGEPLIVADTKEAVDMYVEDQPIGIATLH